MKTIKNKLGKFFTSITALIGLAALASCGNEMEEWIENRPEATEGEHVMVMHLVGGRTSYADKRTTSTDWTDGDVIYLRFYQADGETVVCGKAVYKETESTWNVSYYGNLATGSPYKCEVFHFTNATTVDNYNIKMGPSSCAYVDENATYMVDGGELVVSANLTPLTARMRIQGEADKKVTIRGISIRSAFNLTENKFTDHTFGIWAIFGADGYTPYIYVSPIIPDGTSTKDFTITLEDDYYKYTKTFDGNLFAAGESGYIQMPTQEVNKGWSPTYYYPDGTVDMGLSVRWASMNLGANSELEPGVFCAWGDPDGTYRGTATLNVGINNIAGNPNYDIATKHLGERWAIPTQAQWQELMDNCTWTYERLDGVFDQWKVTAPNGNSIRLPMYNSVYGTSPDWTTTATQGRYWASTSYSDTNGRALYLTTSETSWNYDFKECRMQIRPVLVK